MRYQGCKDREEGKEMNNGAWSKYVDESYALLGQDFINTKGIAASGFNLTQLKADLSLIK